MSGTRALPRMVIALLIAVGLAALTSTAMAGAGNPTAGVAKNKKKTCPAGTHKVVIKRHGRKRQKCVPNPTATQTAVLSISPASYRFPDTEHGGFPCQVGTTSCSTRDFTVTNTGTQQSGVLIVGIREVHNPEVGGPAAFLVSAGTCSPNELLPGASCSLTVQFAPNSNAGDQQYSSELLVSASPGGDAKAEMSGMAL